MFLVPEVGIEGNYRELSPFLFRFCFVTIGTTNTFEIKDILSDLNYRPRHPHSLYLAERVRKSSVFKWKTAVFPIFILRVGTNAAKKSHKFRTIHF